MKDYFLFNNSIEYSLLSGSSFDDLNKKRKLSKYASRTQIWFDFLEHCKINKKNLVILINGASNSGKSSWAIELSRRLGIKNLIHTDTVRNTIRKFNKKNKNSIIHKSSYMCWQQYNREFCAKAEIKGFKSQSRIIIPYIDELITECNNNGQFTIIEGIHLIPSLINKKKFKSTYFLELYFHLDNKKLISERLIKRTNSNYLHRFPEKYIPHMKSFNTLRNFLYRESKKNKSSKIINNEKADDVLNKVFSFIFSQISKKL